MAFDSPPTSWQPWAFVSGVISSSLIITVGSLVGSLSLIRRSMTWLGLAVSLIPLASIGIFWMWLSQQSFT